VRRYQSAQIELGATDVTDVSNVPLPPNLERIVKGIQQHVGADSANDGRSAW
jgi:hypothetical protein